MAEKLAFDDGILELDINENGVLRFNASDPNVYRRFYELAKELPELEKEFAPKVKAGDSEFQQTGATLEELKRMDTEIKARLAHVFGEQNDFDALLGGISLMAYGKNGELVVTNFLNALAPYLEAGAKQHMKEAASVAVSEARGKRAQRRAKL